jgi:hypothetical protein
LFYFTIFFALVGWGHKWLIAGALGASLVYSGQASIHACLLIWSRNIKGENDLWALAAILGTSAIMAVPLLNWSKSIRDLSLEQNDSTGRGGFSKARTIIVYWGFLVVIGLVSVLVIIAVPDNSLGHQMWIGEPRNIPLSCTVMSSASANATFPPPELRQTDPITGANMGPVIDQDWASEHNCYDPCPAMAAATGPATFRQADDYQLIAVRTLVKLGDIDGQTTDKDRLAVNFQQFIRFAAVFVLPYIICQGMWAIAFGRRSPSQTRDALYIYLRDGGKPASHQHKPRFDAHPNRKRIAKILALCTYAWALFVTVISMPVLFLTILALETYINTLPETAALTSIDSWSTWAGTTLVLLAALISKFHNRAIGALRSGSPRIVFSRIRKSLTRGAKHITIPIWNWMLETPSFEWRSLRAFLHDTDSAVWFDRHGRRMAPPIGADQLRAVHAAGSLPLDLSTVVPRSSSSWLIKQKASASSAVQPSVSADSVGNADASATSLSQETDTALPQDQQRTPTEISSAVPRLDAPARRAT